MGKRKFKRADVIAIAFGALLAVVIGVSVLFITWSNLNANIVAKADSLHERSDVIYSSYDKSLENLKFQSIAKLSDSNVITGVTDSGVKRVGVVTSQGGSESDVIRRAKGAGLDVSLVVRDSDGVYVYLIQPGDTLTYISRVFGYSVDQLANYNQIRDVNLIYSNSSLRIPKD